MIIITTFFTSLAYAKEDNYYTNKLKSITIGDNGNVHFSFSEITGVCLQIKDSRGNYFTLQSLDNKYVCSEFGLMSGYDLEMDLFNGSSSQAIVAGEKYQICDYSTDGNHSCGQPVIATTLKKQTVRCEFEKSKVEQKCYTNEGQFLCSGVESCTAEVSGLNLKTQKWNSSCGIGGVSSDGANFGLGVDSRRMLFTGCAPVKDIKISGKDNDNRIAFKVNGRSEIGYAVIWSKKPNPTYVYPEVGDFNYNSYGSSVDYGFIGLEQGTGTYYVRICEYLDHKCGVYSNEIKINITNKEIIKCSTQYNPVCGTDGITYSAKCMADLKKVKVSYDGECKTSSNNILNDQEADLKYLRSLSGKIKKLSPGMQTAINNFVKYGADDNTKKIGEGERIDAISSYESAFKKFPANEAELLDVINIANGNFPNASSSVAEKTAKGSFYEMYKRYADISDAKDMSAIKIMAYGLRQKVQKRKLSSEKSAISTFKSIFKHDPETKEDWNILQALAYSGATKKTDTDKDGLADETEKKIGTDPKKADTDNDGFSDGVEYFNGYDPLKK